MARVLLLVGFACFAPRLLSSEVPSAENVSAEPFTLAAEFQFTVSQFRAPSDSFGLGDLDGDGTFDIITPNGVRWGTNIFLNLSTTDHQWPGFEVGRRYALFDMDNDNRLDLLSYGNSAFVLLNKNGHFEKIPLGQIPGSNPYSAFCDINGDGKMDILSGRAGVFTNHTTGFASMATNLDGVDETALAGDVDNDGDIDIIFGGSLSGVLLNQAGISFVPAAVERSLPLQSAIGEVLDVNNDGKLDLLMHDRFFFQRAHGLFVPGSRLSPNGWAASGDFDSDGLADAATAEIYRNNGDESFFSLDPEVSFPQYLSAKFWADMDQDGDLDLTQVDKNGFAYIFRNNLNKSNAPPISPADLNAVILPHNQVEFTWRPATNPETGSSGGLSYNLRVGRTPGGTEVLSPLYNEPTGTLLKPFRGNAGVAPLWRLRNLARGTYYWSVQAIDHGFAPSPFAPEATFEITEDLDPSSNRPPELTGATLSGVEDEPIFIPDLASDPDGDPTELVWSHQPDPSLPPFGGFWREENGWRFIPSTNFYGTLRIPVRAYDGISYSSTREIIIEVAPREDRLQPPSLWLRTYGYFGYGLLSLSGEPYGTYALESSTNLLDWAPELALNLGNHAVGYHAVDVLPGKKFYRMHFLE